jgi:hypothetical protein
MNNLIFLWIKGFEIGAMSECPGVPVDRFEVGSFTVAGKPILEASAEEIAESIRLGNNVELGKIVGRNQREENR